MSQIITASNTYSETMIDLTCPRCNKKNEIGLLRFLDANNLGHSFICVHCKMDFYVQLTCLTRVAERRDGADLAQHSGAEKNYSTVSLIRDLANALDNGYQTLGDTDIGDLLLECEVDGEGQQNAPS